MYIMEVTNNYGLGSYQISHSSEEAAVKSLQRCVKDRVRLTKQEDGYEPEYITVSPNKTILRFKGDAGNANREMYFQVREM